MPTTHPRHASPLKAKPKKSSQQTRTPLWLKSHIDPIRDLLRSKEFNVMGRLSFVSIVKPDGTQKLMDFRRSGPFAAEAKNVNQVLLISEWTGLPSHLEASATPCPDCQSDCQFCHGMETKTCTLRYCGGRGKREDPDRSIDFSAEEFCPACRGTGKVKCDGCAGTGFYSTGLKDGAKYDPDVRPKQPLCETCQGRRNRSTETPVNLLEFQIAQVGSASIIGEIARFIVMPENGRAAYQYDVMADSMGDGMFMVIESGKPQMAYLVGGIAVRKDVGK
jgi:hypothetical protein